MSPTAPGSNEPQPAISTPAPPPQEFDLLAFWIQYRRLIIRLFAAALIGVAIWGAFLFMEYRKRAGSEEAFANAKAAVDYRKVSTDWSGTPAAGTATIRLAEELRKDGKATEAADALRDFLAKYPMHPLRVSAAHALAASLETAGKLDEALVAYQQFGTAHSRSAFAPLAAIGQARVLLAKDKPEEAQKVLESAEQKYQGSPFVFEARQLLDEIKNAAGRKTGGSPRPTPPPTPAPAPNLQGGTPLPLVPGVPPTAPGLKIEGTVPMPKPPDAPTTPTAPPATPATPPATPTAPPATPAVPPATPATPPATPATPPATPATPPATPATPPAAPVPLAPPAPPPVPEPPK